MSFIFNYRLYDLEYSDEPSVGPSLPTEDVDEEELERQAIIRRADKMKDKLEGLFGMISEIARLTSIKSAY